MDDNSDMDDAEELLEAKIIRVNQLESVSTCIHCKKGKIGINNPNYRTCENCNTAQVPQKIKLTAKLFLEGSDVTPHSIQTKLFNLN